MTLHGRFRHVYVIILSFRSVYSWFGYRALTLFLGEHVVLSSLKPSALLSTCVVFSTNQHRMISEGSYDTKTGIIELKMYLCITGINYIQMLF